MLALNGTPRQAWSKMDLFNSRFFHNICHFWGKIKFWKKKISDKKKPTEMYIKINTYLVTGD